MKYILKPFCLLLLSIITFITLPSCGASNSVDSFLDSYEKIVAEYEDMATDDAFANGDLMGMLDYINKANEASLEMAQKYEELKEVEWSSKQQTRYLSLANRFSQAMLKLSQSMQ